MVQDPLLATVIAKRLSILAELDASAGVSFMDRSRLRLRVFGIVNSLDLGTITTATAADLFERLERDVAALRAPVSLSAPACDAASRTRSAPNNNRDPCE